MVQWLGPIWGVNLQVIGAKAKPFMEVKCEELTTGESRGEWHWFSVGQGAAMDFALPLAARFGRRRARARRDIDAACAAIDGGPRPDSGQEPEGTASVKPHTCQLQANSKPFASRVHGRCSGVFFVFSWYSHGIHPVGTHRNFVRARQTIPVYSRHSATNFLTASWPGAECSIIPRFQL